MMPLFIPAYEQVPIHKLMLSDSPRVGSYARALRQRVGTGATVLDLGTGTGILAALALECGAKSVVAVERSAIAAVAAKVLARWQDRATLVQQDSRKVNLPQEIEVLVSEWMGVHVFQENMIPAVLDARDRFLRPGGVMIPERVVLSVAGMRKNPIYAVEIGRWLEPVEGIDLSEIAILAANDLYICSVAPEFLTTRGTKVLSIDLYTFRESPLYCMRAVEQVNEATVVEAICGWFMAELAPGVVLDTSPFVAPTHWQHAIYPFSRPIHAGIGEEIALEIEAEPHEGYCEFAWRGFVLGREAETLVEQSTKKGIVRSLAVP